MRPESIKETILANAEDVKQLHARVHETFKLRDQNPLKCREWELACREFHSRYDELAFPGGYNGALESITAGDAETMENAICFLECRPYFFRSGYMFESILRRTKRAPLSKDQSARLQKIVEKFAEWKKNRKSVKWAIMKYTLSILVMLLSYAAGASTKLADCDKKPYDVTIINNGEKRVATLTPGGGVIEEFGPNVTFQLEGQPAINTHEQLNEYCIWHGRIILQTRDSGKGPFNGGGFNR